MNTPTRIAFVAAFVACSWIHADILMLKTGAKHVGTISRPAPGKISVTTAQGALSFNDDQVNFPRCSYARPADADDAMTLLTKKQFAKALPMFEAWEKRYRNLPCEWFEKALYGTAVCKASTGKATDAVPLFDKLLAMFPNSSYRSDAESWLIEHQISSASGAELETKLNALLADKRSAEATRARIHGLLGKYYEGQQKWKEALDNYATIIVLYGDIEEFQQVAQRKCADLFAARGRTNEAIFYYQQMLENYADVLTPEDKALCEKWAKITPVSATPQPAAATKPGQAAPTAKPAAPAADAEGGTQKVKAKGLGTGGASPAAETTNEPVRTSES